MDRKTNKPQTTVTDIALKLKISPSTVSRALNNNTRISKKTRELIWKTAAEMKYKNAQLHTLPNIAPHTNNIGVIIPHIQNSLYANAIKEMHAAALENSYNLIVSFSDNSPEREEAIIQNYLAMQITGILISLSPNATEHKYLHSAVEGGTPVVCFKNVNFNLPVAKVILDTFNGAFIATEHLISVGCLHIAMLIGDRNNSFNSDIINGYKSKLAAANLKFVPEFVLQSSLTDEDIENSLENLFSLQNPPDALITPNNFVAFQAITFLKKKGINVPREVSVVSFGTENINKYFSPSVTSIHYSGKDLGKAAINQLFNAIENKNEGKVFENKTIIKPVRLIIRASSMKA